jgi:hypothetical protein
MKKTSNGRKNPYATNDPNMIKAPNNTKAGQPNSSVIKGGDLRSGGKKK